MDKPSNFPRPHGTASAASPDALAGSRSSGSGSRAGAAAAPEPVQIDCGDCVMRDIACGDCVVSVLLGPPSVELDDGEQRAIAVLADVGLVPPLRMAR